jgi:recombination protein RecA
MGDIESVIKDLNKNMKIGTVQLGVEFQETPKLPFSSPRLNYMTYGGIPLGRVAEFSGPDGSGKTTTALDLVGQAQKMFPDKVAAFVDVEHTFDTVWATKLGVDCERIMYIDPDAMSAEDTLQLVYKLASSGVTSIIVIDSIGAMVSEQANEKEIGERTYAGISGPLTTFSNKIAPVLSRTQTILIGINQVRDNLNSPYGGLNTPGGKAWRHACSTRLTFRQGAYVDIKGNTLTKSCENPAGNIVDVSLVKSKVCRPDRKVGYYTLNYLEGIDYIADTFDVALKLNIINQGGAWYSIIDPETGEIMGDGNWKYQGRAKVLEVMSEDDEVFSYINEMIDKLQS